MKVIFTILLFLLCLPSFCQYNFYFGNIHSHSSYSDGNKDSSATGHYTPGDDYNYARESYYMDFLGISEHNHYSANNNPGMHVIDYGRGSYQADTANTNGSFVAMYGFEWGTISQGGHIVTYGVPGLIGWENGIGAWGSTSNYNIFCAKGDFAGYWPIIQSYPGAFCTLAHPQTGDFGNLLVDGTAYNSVADHVTAGISVRSGSAFSQTTDYSDPQASSYESKFLTALAKGYHLGPTIDHDNHYTTFGRTNPSRTVVLATSLHRDSIMAAYKANRFYASDDWNTQVNFTLNGNFMGSDVITTDNSSISITVTDPDAQADPGDNTGKIEIFYGIPESGYNATILVSNTGSNSISFAHITSLGSRYYYYIKITQVDRDIIWTSPIWIFRNAIILPIVLTQFTGTQIKDGIKLNWTTAQEINADYFDIEHSMNGNQFEKTGMVYSRYQNTSSPTSYEFSDMVPKKGINFYRLKQFDMDGHFRYSAIIPVHFNQTVVKAIKINPNPVSNNLNMTITVAENAEIIFKIYDAEGRQVKRITAYVNAGKNMVSTDVSRLANGNYIVVLIINNKRIAETKFVKQ
ncbi:MAG: T9SS type A sorting domain-containing protein [Ferruginibacter sp.]